MLDHATRQKITDHFCPTGVIIDDSSESLYKTVEQYANDQSLPFEYEHIFQAQSSSRPLNAIANADFVVVDHRLEGRFQDFSDGLDVVKALRQRAPRVPVFYCSAFGREFMTRSGKFRGSAQLIDDDPYCFFFSKGDLVEAERLPEFVEQIFLQSFQFALERLKSAFPAELQNLLEAQIVSREHESFRVLGNAGRGRTLLRPLGGRNREDEAVPKRLLDRAGANSKNGYVSHFIVELSNGIVMSGFAPKRLTSSDVNPAVMRVLKEEIDD